MYNPFARLEDRRPSGALRHFVATQRVTGILLMLFSLTMLPPLGIALYLGEDTTVPFLSSLFITFATGTALWWPSRRPRAELKIRDGFLITVLFWTVLGLFGAIPLYFANDGWFTFTDAFFESVSGLTTTGATTVDHGLDDLPKSLNYYRAQLHWLGGMGIIVLAVAVLPMLGIGGMQLYKAETPGPMKDSKLTPRITETARVLWIVYSVLTVACGLAYWAAGMSVFDAICHAFSTLSTGGFSTHDLSIGYYHSVTIEIVAMFFMLVGTTNFAVHFMAWQDRSPLTYWRDSEFKVMIGTMLVFGAIICLPLWWLGTYDSFGSAVRHGMFQLVAFGTSGGFATDDPSGWPGFLPLMLILAAFFMGSSGSTAGGVKMIRLVLFVKQAFRELHKLAHPSAESPIKLGGKVVADDIVYAVGGFFSVYVGLLIVLTFVMIGTGLDPVTALSAVSAALNNTGPGLGAINSNVGVVSTFGKWIMILAMLLGRLEVFTLLIIFTPTFWRR